MKKYGAEPKVMGGDRFILLGDAFSFVDPVFSTGVHFALTSASKGAEVVDSYLRGESQYGKRLVQFERDVRNGLASISWFIYRFTQPAFEQLFVYPRQNIRRIFRMEHAVLALLAGDIFKNSSLDPRLWLFKMFYFLFNLMLPKRNFAAYIRRRRSVHEQIEIDA
jgi:flavin-dependent dehydrogenase